MCYTTFSVGLKDMEKIQQMKNLEELKEQIQEDIMTWHDGLEHVSTYPYLGRLITHHGHEPNAWNDMDKLCDIVVGRINEYKMFESAQLVVDDEIYDFGPEC